LKANTDTVYHRLNSNILKPNVLWGQTKKQGEISGHLVGHPAYPEIRLFSDHVSRTRTLQLPLDLKF